MHETRTTEASPEQLLKMLELQLDAQRRQRRSTGQNRTAMRVGGIALMIGGLIAALLFLQMAASEFSSSARSQSAAETPGEILPANF